MPKEDPRNNNTFNSPEREDGFKSVDSFKDDFVTLRNSIQNGIRFSFNTFKNSTHNGDMSARDNLTQEVKGYRDELSNFLDDLPSERYLETLSLSKEQLKKEKKKLADLHKSVSEVITRIEKDFSIGFANEMEDLENNSPEKKDEREKEKIKKIKNELSKSLASFYSLYSEIEERKKSGGNIKEIEKAIFLEKLDTIKGYYYDSQEELKTISETNRDMDNFDLKKIFDVMTKVEGFDSVRKNNSLLTKIEKSLNTKINDGPEKILNLEKRVDELNQYAAKLYSEVSTECDKIPKGERLSDHNSEKFEHFKMKYVEICAAGTLLDADIEDFLREAPNSGFLPSTKDIINLEKVSKKREALDEAINKYVERLGRNDYMTAREQRENAKDLSQRVNVIEKEINEDHEKLEVGESFSDDKKESFKLMLDVEIVNLKHAENNLEGLEDNDANQPTRSLVENMIHRVRDRIEKLEEKIEKNRQAKEKDIILKLGEAEKEIESVEETIMYAVRRNSEGKQKYKHDKAVAEAAHKASEGKVAKVVVDKYQSPGTYHDQKSISDNLVDPKKYIEEARVWAETLPEETEKESKTKRRLIKKIKRMKRRLSSAKWRHYMTISPYDKGAYLGDKLGSGIVGVAGDVLDRVFG